jgi:MinD-like ATPase involved in chromosome partitioning or flagellar assembly
LAIISILGTKGGVGKSTVAMGLAIWMSKMQPDRWILLIDGDMHVQTVGLKMCPVTDVTLAEVLDEGKPVEEAVYQCELEADGKPLFPRLAILPAGGRFLPAMRGNPLEFISETKRKFDAIVSKLRKMFSYIIVDTPASMSFEHLILTSIADRVLYVCEPNDDSIEATRVTAVELKKFMNVESLGVVLNRVPPRVDEKVWIKKASRIDRVLGVIHEDESVGEAFRQNLPIVAVAPDSPASRALEEIARRVLEVEIKPTKVSSKIDRALQQTAKEVEGG